MKTSFHQNRWDYVYYLRRGRSRREEKRWLIVTFADDKVTEIRKDVPFGETDLAEQDLRIVAARRAVHEGVHEAVAERFEWRAEQQVSHPALECETEAQRLLFDPPAPSGVNSQAPSQVAKWPLLQRHRDAVGARQLVAGPEFHLQRSLAPATMLATT